LRRIAFEVFPKKEKVSNNLFLYLVEKLRE